MALVSVIVRTKERPHLLAEALASLAAQTHRDLEVIVVSDGGPEIADLLAGFSFPRLKYLRHEVNRGRSAAANTGLDQAQGEFIGFLDEDDLLLPWAVETLLAALSSTEAPVAYGVSRLVQEEGDRVVFRRLFARPFDRDLLLFENYIPMGSFLVTRRALSGVRFEEGLSCLEDWDFLLKLRERGDFVFVDRLVHIYRLHPDSFSAGLEAPEEKEAHWQRLYARWWSAFSPEVLSRVGHLLREELLQAEHRAERWQENYQALLLKYHRLAQAYQALERKLADQEEALASLREEISSLSARLAEREATLALIHDSLGYKLLERFRKLKERIFPVGTRRRRFYDLGLKATKVLLEQGPRALLVKGQAWLAKRKALGPQPLRPALEGRVPPPEEIVLPRPSRVEVSIIVPVYNQVGLTLRALAALARSGPPIFEVIVVDDASQDATPELLPRVPGLHYVRHDKNRGFLEAVATGARRARGEVLVLLNNDTEVTPGWLEALLKTLKEPGVGLVGAKLIYPDGRLQEAGGIIFRDASGWNYGHLDDPRAPEYNFRREVDYCSGAALAIRRELFEELGGFDPLFRPAYYEDVDLAFRVREKGLKVVYEPRAEVFHLEGASCGRDLERGVKRHQRLNQKKFYEKWHRVLSREHFPPDPDLVFLARMRLERGVIFVADHYVPMWDQDAGSLRLYYFLRFWRRMGFHVIFWPDNLAPLEPYTSRLQALGVEVIYGARDLETYLREKAPFLDLVWAARVRFAAPYLALAKKYGLTAVFDTVDLHFLREAREARLRGDERALRRAAETERQELRLARAADLTVVTAPYEKEILEGKGIEKVAVLPTVHQVAQEVPGLEGRSGLLFVGNFQHPPNEDAVCWFVAEILPRIEARRPGVEFLVVGANPTARVKALAARTGVRVTGFVPDLSPYFSKARVFVAPIRYGAGLKGKVGEALARGLPVVATPTAAEGLAVRSGEELLLAEGPEEFAEAVLRLLEDDRLWQHLSERGRAFVSRHLSPEAVEGELARLMTTLVPEPRFRRYLRPEEEVEEEDET